MREDHAVAITGGRAHFRATACQARISNDPRARGSGGRAEHFPGGAERTSAERKAGAWYRGDGGNEPRSKLRYSGADSRPRVRDCRGACLPGLDANIKFL